MSRRLTTLIPVLILSICSCAKMPPTHYYMLGGNGVAASSAAAGDEGGLTIGVRSFQVDAPFDQDHIVYRIGEASPEIHYYAYHRWAAPPSRMLPMIVARGLRGAPGVRRIEPVSAGRDYGAYLDGRVLDLVEIDRADGQLVRVEIELWLTSAAGVELWSGTLAAEGVAQAGEVAQIVERMAQILDEALRETRSDLSVALRGAPGG